MRYIFRDLDGVENLISLDQAESLDNNLMKFSVDKNIFYVRNIGQKYYISQDNLAWKKIVALSLDNETVFINSSYKVFRGFKPSGLADTNPGSLITQMPGKVVRLLASVGQKVTKGQTLLILEAMKMENEIKAAMDGEIKSINVQEGQALDSGHLMIELV